jgi:hypothetical protein
MTMSVNPHVIDPSTDTALRGLDAAEPLTEQDAGRADLLLASILSSDPSAAEPTPTPAPRRRPTVRWASAAAALAAVTAGGVAVSTLTAPAAYASWTATPSAVTDAETATVVAACRDQIGTLGGSHGEELPPGVPPMPSVSASDLGLRLAERRGDWVYVSLTAATGDGYDWSADCIAELPAGSTGDPEHVSSTASGGGGLPAPEGREFTEGSISEFGATDGLLGLLGRRDEPASATNGRVGPDVAGVTIHAGSVSVEASVKDGTYAAWWPGHAFDPSQPLPPSGQGGPEPTITYDVTLKDGTVLKDAKPWRPAGEPSTTTAPGSVSSSASS